jgi:hypothetical protein
MSDESNEKSVSQNEVARFLLGLGIGLVVGHHLSAAVGRVPSRIPRERQSQQ